MLPKEWTARFGPLDGKCCVNCMYFKLAIDALPTCAVEQHPDIFAKYEVAVMKEMLHQHYLMTSGDQVYAEMLPIPDAFESSDVPVLLQNSEALDEFMCLLGHHQLVEDWEGDIMPEEQQHEMFQVVGRVVKKLILEQALTRREHETYTDVIAAYEHALPRARNEQADHFGDMKYFVQRHFEHVSCTYHSDYRGKQPYVEAIDEAICSFIK